MNDNRDICNRDRWAQFRFSVIGPLLSAPPAMGELRGELARIAAKLYKHPITGSGLRLGASTIERWYYAARKAADPLETLKNRLRKDRGAHPSLSLAVRALILTQHQAHSSWSYRLHYDNLHVLIENRQDHFGLLPSYAVVRRWMKGQGLYPRKRRRTRYTAGARRAEQRLERAEVRSYEREFVGALFHADFHSCSRQVLTKEGHWVTPQLFAILDDKSRLCCHGQWYLAETAENCVHGLSQAIMKRGLPRALMTDQGAAFTAAEVEEGLMNLGVLHELTLPYSPYQNAKQEVFWVPIERRLLAMLEGVKDLTLERLNEATQAWIELEYNRHLHSEIATTPLSSFLSDKNVLRESPSAETIRQSFCIKPIRTQRRSDGTVSIEGVRFEIPSRLRHLPKLKVRYPRWELSCADVVDHHTGVLLATIYPLNKVKNADGHRRSLQPIGSVSSPPPDSQVAPLLKKLLADYAASGLPPAYIPKQENQ